MSLKILFCLVILVCVWATAPAQTACTKPESETPAIRGFRLGMTIDQVKQFQPFLKDERDETGYFSFKPAKAFLSDNESRGVSQIELGFLDGQLVSIIVLYDDSTKWQNITQFSMAISQSLGVPPLGMGAMDSANNVATLQVVCGKVTYGVGGSVATPFKNALLAVFRNDTKPIRDARRAEIEEMKRRSFKP